MTDRALDRVAGVGLARRREARRREAELERLRREVGRRVLRRGLGHVLHQVASGEAEHAHRDLSWSRRGTIQVVDNIGLGTGTLLSVYNNHPYEGSFVAGSGCPRRDAELDAVAELVAPLGLARVARAAYPAGGEEAGYTVVDLYRLPAGADAGEMEDAIGAAYYGVLSGEAECSP
jgi:hypothetical protein